ncbi:transposase [uncultured Chryseobacterium sp.]|uniref:transposase n=1 Tax=uncultured Chryseobacterium sp. TaxID=259322 RepID=UPI0026002C56|nr:transposase [uncultured Chryseobacterium sp.]
MDFKNIHIGKLIQEKVSENEVNILRICNFFKAGEEQIYDMYECHELSTGILLRWSKLLEYDFFRMYSQHLILYAPPKSTDSNTKQNKKSELPQFRKSLYTKEMIDFILEMIETQKKTKLEVIQDYNIPKTTLYKWIEKSKR